MADVGNNTCVNVKKSVTTDRISSLPDEVLHDILSFLSMKDAILTSSLSKRWMYLYTFNPNLNFPLDFNLTPECSDIINSCLHLSKRPNINRLFIELFADKDTATHVETWIEFATTRGVRELTLRFFTAEAPLSHLPKSLFFHTPLMELTLSFCIFSPPPEFKGFSSLKVLQLRNVHITDQMVQNLLVTSPLLEKLSIVKCNELTNLHLSSPNAHLKMLEVDGCVCLKKLVVNAPNLLSFRYLELKGITIRLKKITRIQNAVVCFQDYLNPEAVHEWAPLVRIMGNAEFLSVSSWFSQFIFAEYCVSRIPHVRFMNLKEFYWDGDLTSDYEVLALATFLGDCPSLQKLYIYLQNRRNVFDWYHPYYDLVKKWIPPFQGAAEAISKKKNKKHYLQHLHYALHHLKAIEIVGFLGRQMEMDLVVFLLDKAAVLDYLLLDVEYDCEQCIPRLQLEDQLSRLPTRSTHAQIVLQPELPPGDMQ